MSSSPFNLETGFQNIIVRAGAGAGKTTRLVAEVLNIADQFHQKYDRMPRLVVTTFTRKATQELKERLTHQAMKMDRPDLVQFIRHPQQLCLGTIHGVVTQFLIQNGHVLGLGQGLRFSSVRDQRILMRKVLRQMVDQASVPEATSIFQSYSVHQLLGALSSYYENWLCGTTACFSIEDHQQVWNKKLETISECSHRLGLQILHEAEQDAWKNLGSHLVSLAQILKSSQPAEVRDHLETFFETMPQVRYLKNKPAVSFESKESWDCLKEDLQDFAFEEKWDPVNFQAFAQLGSAFQNIADDFCRRFLEKKIQNNQISMSDIEGLALRVLQLDPSTGEKFAKEWDYWFIDEFQDTSPRQIQLIEKLRADRCSFYVGDPQQSIYLFRGSRSEVFLQEEEKIQAGSGKVQTMMTNYRSSPAVLNFINEVFHQLGTQFSKMLVDPAKLSEKAEQSVSDSSAIQLTLCADSQEEELAVVHRVLELLKQGVSAEEIAILTRTNRHLQLLARRLEEFQIPVQVHSSGSFYQRREVMDATAFLRFLCQPWNDLNLMSLLRSPWMNIQDQELIHWSMNSSDHLWTRLKKHAADHPVVASLQKFLEQAQTMGVLQVWISMMDHFEFIQSFSAYDPSGQMEANVWKLIRILRQKERQVGFQIFEILDELQDLSSMDAADGDGDAVPVIEPARVALMTVHASKGLQFRHVILPYLGEGSRSSMRKLWMLDETANKWSLGLIHEETQSTIYSPCMDAHFQLWKQREDQESERVFYVACTRAKEGLHGMGSKIRKGSWLELSGLKTQTGLHSLGPATYLVEKFQPESIPSPSAQFLQSADLASAQKLEPMIFPSLRTQSSLQVVAVTDVIQVQSSEPSSMDSAKMLRMFEASHQGIRIHQLFESLKYNPQMKIDEDLMPAYQFLQKWENGQMLKWIQIGNVEWGFTCLLQDQIVQGQIDMWVRTEQNDVWIVDYKTGSSHFAQKAFEQLRIYQQALQKLGQLKSVRHVICAVVFPWEEKVLTRQEQCGE